MSFPSLERVLIKYINLKKMKYTNYKTIKELVPYDKCLVDILPYLKKQFTFEEFVEQFLLVFNNSKVDIINSLGMKRFKWWLRRYYLPRVAYKCRNYRFTKDKTLRWAANSNHSDFRISFNVTRFR